MKLTALFICLLYTLGTVIDAHPTHQNTTVETDDSFNARISNAYFSDFKLTSAVYFYPLTSKFCAHDIIALFYNELLQAFEDYMEKKTLASIG